MARKRLPQIIYAHSHMDLYKQTSEKVMHILQSFTPDVEICSIDEAFMDLTGTKSLYKQNYVDIACAIRKKVWNDVHIPISIGLSHTKTLAKLASDKAKSTHGLFLIGNAKRRKVLLQTPIGDVSGVGKQNLLQMRNHCIFTALDFVSRPEYWVNSVFGKRGTDLWHELSGTPLFKVSSEVRKPLSIQQTEALKNFTTSLDILKRELCKHIHTVCHKARLDGAKTDLIEVMLRTKDFHVLTLKSALERPTNVETEIIPIALHLLECLYSPQIIWRSTGISFLKLTYHESLQLNLFEKPKKNDEKLGKVLDELEGKFGKNIIHFSTD